MFRVHVPPWHDYEQPNAHSNEEIEVTSPKGHWYDGCGFRTTFFVTFPKACPTSVYLRMVRSIYASRT